MILARTLVRLVSFTLLVLLALAGLALVALALAPVDAAKLLGLPALRDEVGRWFAGMEGDGPVAVASALGGLGAVLVGLLLLMGLLMPPRERLVSLPDGEHGTIGARRRPLTQAATQLAERAEGVSAVKARIKPGRRGGGRLRVRAERPRSAAADPTKAAVVGQLEPLTGPFGLKPGVQTRVGERGSRVQ